MKRYTVLSNSTEWCYYSWKPAVERGVARFFNEPVPVTGPDWMKKLAFYHFILRAGKIRKAPFTSIWYRNIDRTLNLDNSEENRLIFYDWNFLTKDFSFLKYLRRRHPGIKLIYLFSNIVSVTGAVTYNILNELNDNFDAVFAFDMQDAEKYGFLFSPLIYTNDKPTLEADCENDIFYIGNAKDRLPQLIEIYEKATADGLKCNFNIVGVPEEKQKHADKIHYNKPLKYADIMEQMNRSKCFVDAIQGGSTALTIKNCEAVLYDRKLITTNPNVKKAPFYKPENIMVYPEDTRTIRQFIDTPLVPYTREEKNYFSPEELFRKIEEHLEKKL